MTAENLIMFTSVGSVELIRQTLDVDLLATIARGCKYSAPPMKTADANDYLVKGLLKSKHLSVFEFADVTFRVKCPIFVARQLMRYRTGKYCEKSLRATGVERRAEEKDIFDVHFNSCVDFYQALIAQGYRKEEARRVLPLDTPTAYYFKIDARNLLHLIEERSTAATQAETRETVAVMRDLVKLAAPRFAAVVEL